MEETKVVNVQAGFVYGALTTFVYHEEQTTRYAVDTLRLLDPEGAFFAIRGINYWFRKYKGAHSVERDLPDGGRVSIGQLPKWPVADFDQATFEADVKAAVANATSEDIVEKSNQIHDALNERYGCPNVFVDKKSTAYSFAGAWTASEEAGDFRVVVALAL